MAGRNMNRKQDAIHPLAWLGLVLWASIKGIVAIVFTIAIFVGLVSLLVLVALGYGPQEVAVPNVVNMPLDKAKQAMTEAGVVLEVARQVHTTKTADGCVMETRPAAGKVTREGRKIYAVVSLGPKDAKVPKVVGHSSQAAQQRIREAKLHVGSMIYRADSNPRDHVIEQAPSAGTVVARDCPVNLVLSGGPDYGRTRLSDKRTLLFRSVEVTVPQGQPLQRVVIKVTADEAEGEKTFYNRVHRPGDEVKADFYAPKGATLEVVIDKQTVLSKQL